MFPSLPVHTLGVQWFSGAACRGESKRDMKRRRDALLSCPSLQPFHTRLASLGSASQKLPVPETNMLGVKLGARGRGRGRGRHNMKNFPQSFLALILLSAQVNGDRTDPHGGPIYPLEEKKHLIRLWDSRHLQQRHNSHNARATGNA